MNVTRLYTRANEQGYLALFGEIPTEALRLRSGATLYVHLKGNKTFTAESGEELYQKVRANKCLEGEEILKFKLDFNSKINEAKQVDWKE